MNTDSHLTVGSHLTGLKADVLGSATSSGCPTTSSSAADIISNPSVQSLAINVDMYLSSQPSGEHFCSFSISKVLNSVFLSAVAILGALHCSDCRSQNKLFLVVSNPYI